MLGPRRAGDVRMDNNVRGENYGQDATFGVRVWALEPTWYDPQGVNTRQEGSTMMTAWRGCHEIPQGCGITQGKQKHIERTEGA